MAVELTHEGLAETHDLAITLALGVEVGPTLTTPEWQTGKRILPNLLEAEELENREINRRVEAQTTLVWPKCGIELDAITAVHPHFTLIVHPSNAENDCPFGLNNPLKNFASSYLLISLGYVFNRV